MATRTTLHDIDKYERCNQINFVLLLDEKNRRLICAECDTVNKESFMHEGNVFRKFEGQEDKNHHGDISNRATQEQCLQYGYGLKWIHEKRNIFVN